jgi:hypothetical protein
MTAIDRAKVRELLENLTTTGGRRAFLKDPERHLRNAGIESWPQHESDLPPVEEYQKALASLDANRFGDEYSTLDSLELACVARWLIPYPPRR